MPKLDEKAEVLSKPLMGGRYFVAVLIPGEHQVRDEDSAELVRAVADALRQFADKLETLETP